MAQIANDFKVVGGDDRLIPHGLICKIEGRFRPGGEGDEGLFRKSKSSDALLLDWEFTVLEGAFSRSKFWEFMPIDGAGGAHTLISLRAMLESSKGIVPDDRCEAACIARKLSALCDLDGITFAAEIVIEPGSKGFPAQNRLGRIVPADRPEWHRVMVDGCDILPTNIVPFPQPAAAPQQMPDAPAPEAVNDDADAILSPDLWGVTTMHRGNGQRIEVTSRGVVLVTEKKDKITKATYEARAPVTYQPISAYALTVPNDPDDEEAAHGVVIKWRDVAGRTLTRAVPASFMVEPGGVIDTWVANAGIKFERQRLNELKNYLSAAQPDKQIVAYSRMGWQQAPSGNPVFVIGKEVIGAQEESVFQASPTTSHAKAARRGTLAEWQEHVVTPALQSPGWRFGLCAGFVGPLLRVLNEPSPFVHIGGTSSHGKTIMLYCAGSVWGKGTKSDADSFVRSWNSTANAIEGEAAAHDSMILCFDEISEVKSASDFGNIIYMIASGQGKARMNANSSMRQRKDWRVMVMSTGEMSLETKVKETQTHVYAGQLARAADIWINGESLFPKFSNTAFVKRIEASTGTYYGSAGPEFMRSFIGAGYALPGGNGVVELQTRLDQIQTALVGDEKDSIIIRATRQFALIQLAGELAVKFGLLPADIDAEGAVKQFYNVWRKGNGAVMTDDNKQTAGRLVEYINSHIGADIIPLRDEQKVQQYGTKSVVLDVGEATNAHSKRKGWISEDGNTVYLLREALKEVCGGYSVNAFVDAAINQGALPKQNGKEKTRKVDQLSHRPHAYWFNLEKLREWAGEE